MKNDKSKERGDRRALFEYEWHYSAPAARAASRQAPLNRYRKGVSLALDAPAPHAALNFWRNNGLFLIRPIP